MAADRQFYNPEGGIALDKDNAVFDVTQWRKDGNQTRNGQEHHRVYDPEIGDILRKILEESRKTNVHLSILTGEEL